MIGRAGDLGIARHARGSRRRHRGDTERSAFVLRQFDSLPGPLTSAQGRELLVELPPPYDLMTRRELYTGLRVSELLRLSVKDVLKRGPAPRSTASPTYRVNDGHCAR